MSHSDAARVVEQEQVEFIRRKGIAVFYEAPKEESVTPTDLPSKLEISIMLCLTKSHRLLCRRIHVKASDCLHKKGKRLWHHYQVNFAFH